MPRAPRLRNPQLPGGRRDRTVQTYRDPADRLVTVDHAALQRQLVAALTAGPLQKWQLREQLHVPEQILYRELVTLRHAGQVKVVGRRLTDRKWALATWQAPIVPDAQTVIVRRGSPPPAPARTSWWIGLTRAEFQERALKGADAA